MTLTIAQAFDLFKSRLELSQSFQDEVTTHHKAIREWIESYNQNVKTKLIGSLQKKTRIQPQSEEVFDIDILVVLGDFYTWVNSGGVTPEVALKKMEEIVRGHGVYEKLGVETDNPTITFEYEDSVKVELVPAYFDKVGKSPNGTPILPVNRGYWIPKNNNWIIADYDYDSEYISKTNENVGGYLIPTIKMLKAAKRNLFPNISSYHLEVLATNIIPSVIYFLQEKAERISYPNLVWAFFLVCKDRILGPAIITGSKSPSPDLQMVQTEKEKLSSLFNRIASYIEKTFSMNDLQAIGAWQRIFGSPFPSGT